MEASTFRFRSAGRRPRPSCGQIRVHLAHLKHPVLGDDKYGDFELNRRLRKEGLKRMFLHARSLAFAHPISNEPVRIESPLPRDLEEFRLRWLTEAKSGEHG